MTHGVVLAIAFAMSGYTGVDRSLFPAFRAAAVTAAAADESHAVGDVSLGRDSVIIKPLSVPTSALASRAPIVHIVADGDTLESMGRLFKLPWGDVVWSNTGLRMTLKVGRSLLLPPSPGDGVVVRKADTPASLAGTRGL